MTRKLDLVLVNPSSRTQVYQSLATRLAAVEPPTWAWLMVSFCRPRGLSAQVIDAAATQLVPIGWAERALRHDLRVRLLNLRSVTDSALGDRFTSAPREDELWPIAAAVQQVGYRSAALRDGPTAGRRTGPCRPAAAG